MKDATETSDDQPQGGPLEQATRRLAALAVRDAVERVRRQSYVDHVGC